MLITSCPEISYFGVNNFYWKKEKPGSVIRSASWHPSSTIFLFFFLLSNPFAFCHPRSPPSTPSHTSTRWPICPLLLASSHAVPRAKRWGWSTAVHGGDRWTLGYHVLGYEPTAVEEHEAHWLSRATVSQSVPESWGTDPLVGLWALGRLHRRFAGGDPALAAAPQGALPVTAWPRPTALSTRCTWS